MMLFESRVVIKSGWDYPKSYNNYAKVLKSFLFMPNFSKKKLVLTVQNMSVTLITQVNKKTLLVLNEDAT